MEYDSIREQNAQERENSDPLPDNWDICKSGWIRCGGFNCNEVDRWILERYAPFVLFSGIVCYFVLLLS